MANIYERQPRTLEKVRKIGGSLLLFAGTAAAIGSNIDARQDDSFNRASQRISEIRMELSKLNGIYTQCTLGTGHFSSGVVCGYVVEGKPSYEERKRRIRTFSEEVRRHEEEVYATVDEADMRRQIRDIAGLFGGLLAAASGIAVLLNGKKG